MKKNTLFTKTFHSLVFLFVSLLGVAQSSQTFTTSGANTFTVPAGVTQVTVEVWGGGGKGATVHTNGTAYAGGGGGGGAYAKTSSIAVTPGATLNLNVGEGSTTTAAGGDSWFINSTTILAKGGNSVADLIATGGAGGLASASIGTTKYNGGNGANGNVTSNYGGGGGSSAGTGTAGNNGSAQTAGSAPVGGSAGGNGTTGNGDGFSATGFGGGGGGAKKGSGSASNDGGNGANGQVIVSWVAAPTYCAPTYSNGPGTVDQITNVTLGTLNNSSGASAPLYYTFYNAVAIPNLTQSSTVAISVSFGTDANQYAAVWIDFNQNNTFEASEGVITGRTNGAGPVTINIAVPAGALTGNTRMRIRGGDDSALTTSQACGASNSTYGETEDYIVNIVASTPPTITSLGTSSGCAGSSITINGTNLSGATAADVTIGGTAVSSITSNSGTVLVAVVGAGTTGTVSVTTAGGTATSAATFTVISGPTQPSTITGNSSPCSGTSQIYSVTAVGGVTYNWTFPSGWVQTAGGTTSSVTVTTNGTAGTITVTPSNGCSGTARTLSVTPTAPTANAGSALTTICVGATSAALGGSFGGSATSAVWSDGGVGGTFTNNTGSTPNTTTWTPPAAYTGTATLTLTTAGGSCGTTTASKTQDVTTGTFATVASSAITVNGSLTSPALGGSPASGTWTKISGPPGTITFSNASSGSSTATVPSIGTYMFRWTTTSSCGTSSADVTVTYLDANYHRDYTLFYEDFDSSDGGWTNTTNTNGSWVRTDSFPSVAEIGENSFWRTDSFNDYSNNAIIEITSPVYNFTGYENMLFNIDIRYDTETNADGMRILYSVNNGAFVQLGASGSGVNWYNSTTVSALGSNGWSNNNATASLAFTPIGTGANRFIRATTLLADGTFRNQSNVRFKVEFRSNSSTTDNGVAFDNVAVEGDAIVALADSPIAPANINQNLRLWFKSNAGISATDGTPLTAWEDLAYDITRADLINKESVKALTTDAPTYHDNATRNLNFNPVVDFNSANKDYMNGKGGLYSQDYFVVVYPDDVTENTMGSSGRQIPLGGKSDEQSFHEDPTGLGLGNTTARYSTAEVIAHNVGAYGTNATDAAGPDSYGRSFSSTSVTYNEPLLINVKTNASGTETEIYKNGIKIDNLTGETGPLGNGNVLNFYNYKNLPFYLGTGRSGISGRAYSALNGRLSEVVVYTAPNSALNQQKIQSYLGIKYGITLHATNSSNVSGVSTTTRLNDVDYIDSSGSIIWNTIANTGFNYDIAAIGRDDDSQLYQKQSKTVNTSDDITIGLNTIAATNNLNTNTCNNRNFLVWGNNNGTLAAQPEVAVNISSGITPSLTSNVSFVSVGRTWKVVEVGGNVPSTRVSIPTSMLSATLSPPGAYLMFISSTPNFDPTAEYRVMTANGSNLETSYDFDGTKYITFGFAPERTFTRCIKFNGSTDYLDAGKVLDLTPSFTVSAWVNRTTVNRTIFSKRNSSFTEGYDLSINAAGRAEMSWFVGASKKTITSSAVIPAGVWHHIGVIFDGTTAKMYIDGINAVSTNLAGTPTAATNQSFLVAAADGVTPTSYFNGSIDEVRVWNVALTDTQFRYVINQEILSNATASNGAIIPNTITLNEISSIPWANLMAYYPMSTYTYTNAKDISNNNYTASLRNIINVDRQTAPLPYESAANAPWESAGTWTNSSVQYIPNSVSIEDPTKTIDWNIVKSTHNISSSANKTVLGLFVNSNTISATNNTKIQVSHYLKLDGKIDLVGMSQLVQTTDSDLDVTSSGSIERDQQGQANKYSYNYWCSPVSQINSSLNNQPHSVNDVLRDGTNPANPIAINWVGGYDGSLSSPISLARYWIYKFDLGNAYSSWTQIGETGTLQVGKGFTLKGAGTTGNQNLTFVGKPNNGAISNSVGNDELLLTGNPYPSALDANKFITDNIGSIETEATPTIDGTLYFWEHYSTNNTHVLSDYQGGYAIRNLAGGVATISTGVDFISSAGTTSKLAPKQFIPVGQGFFVNGKIGSGGNVVFNNSQRYFVKETDATSQSMYKTKPKNKTKTENNASDPVATDTYKRVRLGYNSYNESFHRQTLLAFMDDKANSEMNLGYDALNIDGSPSDMYLLNGDNELAIEGEGAFNENASFPIGVRLATAGKVSFALDALENFDTNQDVFVYDKVTNTYNSIKNKLYEIELPAGTDNSRFSLHFKDKSSSNDKTLGLDENNSNTIQIAHIQNGNILKITNNLTETSVEKVTLFNILGQSITDWKIENQDEQDIRIPIKNISSGIYIVKIKTDKGETSKKLIIK